MKYDAFISYRHGGLDGIVAEKLHKMLETYHIPGAIAKKIGKKKLARVFRDREELPTSSNLSDSINDALNNSAFLLLICSKRTIESRWVMREVEVFGELRGKDRIITLLIEGEPDESFPPGLRERDVSGEKIFVEPLAADIRADSTKASIKLLKEEKLRLLAPILGCAFDDLRRRHRRRKIRQAATLISAAFMFSLAFGTFSYRQYYLINLNMQQKLINQSYVLAEYSASRLAAGEKEMALLLALSALPDTPPNHTSRPFVPAAEMALSNALGVYSAVDGFKPHKMVNLPAAASKVALSPTEKYAAAVYPYELILVDPESGAIVATLPTVRSALADFVFISDDIIVYTGAYGVEAYDISAENTIWRGEMATSLALSGDGSLIAAVYKNDNYANLYTHNGYSLGTVSFLGKQMNVAPNDEIINPNDMLFALNHDGQKLAASFSDGSISIIDTLENSETVLYPPSDSAIHFAGGFYGDTLMFAVAEKEPQYAALIIYDAANGEEVRKHESNTVFFVPYVGPYGLFTAMDNLVLAINPYNGNVIHVVSAPRQIVSLNVGSEGIMIAETGGAYSFFAKGIRITETGDVYVIYSNNASYASDHACHYVYLGQTYALTGSRDANGMRILKNMPPAGVMFFEVDSSYSFSEAKINDELERVAFYSYNGLRLYDFNGNLINEQSFPDPFDVINTEYVPESGNVLVLYRSAFRLYSGADGSLLAHVEGKDGHDSVVYTPFGVHVLGGDNKAYLYDLDTGKARESMDAAASTQQALIIGGMLIETAGDTSTFGGSEASGKVAGARMMPDGSYAFAVSDGLEGSVYTVQVSGQVTKRFSFSTRGPSEVFFTDGYVFISPSHGVASVYGIDGNYIRNFAEVGYIAEIYEVDGYIVLVCVSTASERYTILLKPDTLDEIALLAGYMGMAGDGAYVQYNRISLNIVNIYTNGELVEKALGELNGRIMTQDEIILYRAG